MQRSVLAVVHNVTSATRLFDVLPLIADDHRVQVHFTCPELSPFQGQITEYLSAREVTPTPWHLAAGMPFAPQRGDRVHHADAVEQIRNGDRTKESSNHNTVDLRFVSRSRAQLRKTSANASRQPPMK